MTPPSPTTPLPSGYELLAADIAKMKPEGMKYQYADRNRHDDPWDDYNSKWELEEHELRTFLFCAPAGTTAMYRTPLPEVRCVCEGIYGTASVSQSQHDLNCPAHPRNRLVRVLPQLLAGLPEKPEGLMWANKGCADWTEGPDWFPWDKESEEADNGRFAYALPRHVLDAIEAGKEKTPLPATGEAKDLKTWEAKWSEIIDSWKTSDSPPGHLADYVQKLHIITGPNGMCMCGENGITCGERLRQVSHEIADCQLIASFQPKVPSQASGPTDGEKWQPIETAPKDGTRILATSQGCEIHLWYWNLKAKEFWIEYADGVGWPPTHWMPLPPPPTVAMKDQTK